MSLGDALLRASSRVPRREQARIRALASSLASAPPTRQALILLALRVRAGRGSDARERESLAAACAYPDAPVAIQARLVLGETPAQISGGLTRAEAHRWLMEMPTRDASEWLLHQHELDDHAMRSVTVARWLISRWSNSAQRDALTRDRNHAGPHGEEISGCYLERVDELRDRDLTDGVEATFCRAGERMLRDVERLMQRKGEPLRSAPRWWRPIRCARILLSAAELAVEGKIMGHCVGGYAGYVQRGESVIIALDVRGYRSTVELSGPERSSSVRVVQHKGPRNTDPHELCRRALTVCLRRWGIA